MELSTKITDGEEIETFAFAGSTDVHNSTTVKSKATKDFFLNIKMPHSIFLSLSKEYENAAKYIPHQKGLFHEESPAVKPGICRLVIFTLPSCFRLFLASYTRFLVMLTLANLLLDSSLCTASFKTT